MLQVQLRLSQNIVDNLDDMISKGLFKSRSDAIRSILLKYEEIEKTRHFYTELICRSKESKNKNKNNLVDFEDL